MCIKNLLNKQILQTVFDQHHLYMCEVWKNMVGFPLVCLTTAWKVVMIYRNRDTHTHTHTQRGKEGGEKDERKRNRHNVSSDMENRT